MRIQQKIIMKLKVKKTVYSNYDTPEGTVSIPHETEVEEKAPIYEAIFNNGIDVKITEGTKIRSSQPGTKTATVSGHLRGHPQLR